VTGIPPQQAPTFSRSLEEIDDDLRTLTLRERAQRERLLGALTDLDIIQQRRERLLDERITAMRRH
jgi:hypothetical protein